MTLMIFLWCLWHFKLALIINKTCWAHCNLKYWRIVSYKVAYLYLSWKPWIQRLIKNLGIRCFFVHKGSLLNLFICITDCTLGFCTCQFPSLFSTLLTLIKIDFLVLCSVWSNAFKVFGGRVASKLHRKLKWCFSVQLWWVFTHPGWTFLWYSCSRDPCFCMKPIIYTTITKPQ